MADDSNVDTNIDDKFDNSLKNGSISDQMDPKDSVDIGQNIRNELEDRGMDADGNL